MERVEPTSVQHKIERATDTAAHMNQARSKFAPVQVGPNERGQPDPSQAERGLTRDNPLELKPRAADATPNVADWAYRASIVFSIFWVGGLSAYFIGYFGQSGVESVPGSWWWILGAVLVVPAAMSAFIAMMLRESRMLRTQARALTHAAGILIQPTDHAALGVTRLGQTVRRELDLFNAALEAAYHRLASLESANTERLDAVERAVTQSHDRVERAAQRLSSEREKLQSFAQSLEQAVSGVGESLTARVLDARAAARAAAEGLHAEQTAISGLLETLNSASSAAAGRAADMSKEVDRQAQKLDAASEAAAARSEQVIQRHERHRAALQETLDRLKSENDHMTRALETQRDGLTRLIQVMSDEAKRVDTLAIDGVRRIDTAAATISQRIIDTAQTLAQEIERLKTQSELSSSGIGQAVETIKSAGESSYDSASRLGAKLTSLSESATKASMEVEAGITRLQQFMSDLPRDVQSHADQLRGVVDGQALAINDLSGRIANAFEQLQALEVHRPQRPISQVPNPPSVNAPKPATPTRTVTPTPKEGATFKSLSPSLPIEKPGAFVPPTPTAPTPEPQSPSKVETAAPQEPKGWLGIAKRLVRMAGPEETAADFPGPQRNWDMKQLLQAAEQAGQQPVETAASIAARHSIESLQSLTIDIDRFLEDDPPLDFLRRYRAGERDIFARRLLQVLGRDNNERLARKYHNDVEFRDTVDRYCTQFETLMTDLPTAGYDNTKAEAVLGAPIGKVYMALARITGRM